ncbi:MAG: PilZ domain-containing protein [Sphingomonadaceae bacterium]|nr:PilZ domain-containing protein [Sphingomonadaceae bacterium]
MKYEVIDNRESKRERVLLGCEIAFGGGRHRAHLLNISESGAKLDADDVPAVGDSITLYRDDHALAGNVNWVQDHRFGIQFDARLDAAVVAHYAAMLFRRN